MGFSTTELALIAIISAVGLVGLVAVDSIEIVQDAEAEFKNSIAYNASQGRCNRYFVTISHTLIIFLSSKFV
jgi:archaellum component FlaF (FlaF/FlaG flagellin family)